MLKYKFSNREIILLLIAALLGLGLVYYSVILKSYNDNVAKYDTSNLQVELSVSDAKLTKYEEMKKYIDKYEDVYLGSVVSYDNLVNLFANFSDVLDKKVSAVAITLNDPIELDTVVRRNATITYTAKNNEVVNNILRELVNSPYRLIINKMTVTPTGENLGDSEAVSVNMELTFFETTKDAKYNYGLVSQGQ